MKISTLAVMLASLTVAPQATMCKKSATQAIEVVKPHTNISANHDFHYHILNNYDNTPFKGKKIVVYMYPSCNNAWYKHTLSAADADTYEKNNIVVKKRDCDFITSDQLKKTKTKISWWNIFFGKRQYCTRLCFSLQSDTHKKIDIYITRTAFCDAKWYSTTHKGRIALLIDEEGNIVSILDNVTSEKDIFTAWGIE